MLSVIILRYRYAECLEKDRNKNYRAKMFYKIGHRVRRREGFVEVLRVARQPGADFISILHA
jgi:hypothetical protein